MISEVTKQTIPFVSFVGNSNSGKTTLIEQVVRELKSLGYKVATVKHASHGFDVDRPGKDSYRLKEAGSDIVVISSPTQLALIKDVDAEESLSRIITLIGNDVDIILLEGYKSTSVPKIVVLNCEEDANFFDHEEYILTTVKVLPSKQGKPKLSDDDVTNIIDLLVDRIQGASAQISQHDYQLVEPKSISVMSEIT